MISARMKSASILLLLLLVVTMALAAPIDDADYVTVVAEADGATGVIAAANFAVAMQAEGYRFTGAIDTEVAGVKNLDEKFLVFLDGKKAVIVDGLGRPDVGAKARAWLEGQGYTVDVSTLTEMAPAWGQSAEKDAAETAPPPPAPEPCTGCTFGTNCLATGTQTGTKYCDASGEMLPLKANGEACAESYECFNQDCSDGTCGNAAAGEDAAVPPPPPEQEEKPRGFFATIFGWFAGLFGG